MISFFFKDQSLHTAEADYTSRSEIRNTSSKKTDPLIRNDEVNDCTNLCIFFIDCIYNFGGGVDGAIKIDLVNLFMCLS